MKKHFTKLIFLVFLNCIGIDKPIVLEPEAFLHPQVQRAITDNIIKESQDKQNFNLIITTHSPYVLNRFSLEKIILIKKDSNHYTDIIIPEIDQKDSAILNDYNNEINSEIFFSDIVFFVEGNGDKRVILKLVQKYLNKHLHRISIIETGGNNTFSPYLKLIGILKKSNIKYGIITDFDSITKSTNRALFTGIKNSGINLNKKKLDKLISEIDKQVGLSERLHTELCRKVSSLLKEHNINAFIFPSDLEYSICEDSIKSKISGLIKEHLQSDLSGFTIDQIRKKIGSKGIDLIKSQEDYKKPFIHEKIIDLYEKKEQLNSSMTALINFINKICENNGT